MSPPKRKDRPAQGPDDYTAEELEVLAGLRRSTGRTCASCAWFKQTGSQRGCFPEGHYRKWLGPKEYEAGCDLFMKRSLGG